MHTVIDDHSRVAYAAIHDDETAATSPAELRRAVAWYADRGVTIERMLSDIQWVGLPLAHPTPRPWRPRAWAPATKPIHPRRPRGRLTTSWARRDPPVTLAIGPV